MERNISIDILRGISIAIVMIAHVGGAGTNNLFLVDSSYFKFVSNSSGMNKPDLIKALADLH